LNSAHLPLRITAEIQEIEPQRAQRTQRKNQEWKRFGATGLKEYGGKEQT
jgi:hypothetical protein